MEYEFDPVVAQLVRSIFKYTRATGMHTGKYFKYLNISVEDFLKKFQKTHFSNLDISEENLKYTIDMVRKDIEEHEEADIKRQYEEWKKNER